MFRRLGVAILVEIGKWRLILLRNRMERHRFEESRVLFAFPNAFLAMLQKMREQRLPL